MHRLVSLLALCGLLSPAPVGAQWRLGLELGAEQVGRFIRSTQTDAVAGPDGRPTQGWPLALRVERGGAGLRLGLSVARTTPGLELFGSELTVAIRPGFEVLTVAPELSGRLARLHGGGQIRAGLAVPLERWSFPTYADPPRWRAGLAAGGAVDFPLSARLSGRIGASLGTVFRNPLNGTELIVGYDTTALWRRSLRIGVQWRP
jgi:hypothetical protein